MEDLSMIVVIVMLSIFSICGTIGNSLVLYIYYHKKEKSTAGIFIMSLAGTDLFTCLFLIPFTSVVVYLQYELKYDVACKIYMFFITCNIPFAAFIMVAIAMDRYFCICHPFLHVLNIKRSKIIVLCLLLMASTFGVITSLSHGVYAYNTVSDPVQNNLTLIIPHNSSTSFLTMYNETHGSHDPIKSLNELYKPWISPNSSTAYNDGNTTAVTEMVTEMRILEFNGICMPNFLIIDAKFLDTYQIVYAATYILSFIVVVVLYGLIYRSIHKHRAKRSKRKRSSLYPCGTGMEFSNVETQFTAVTHINPHGKKNNNGSHNIENGEAETIPELQPMRPKQRQNKQALSIKEKTFLANIRTAVMLFVVTIVFLIAFLPAWLMASKILTYNQIVFYMYFIYHTANPFIYAFMNKSFRDDLGKVIKCQSMPMVR